MVTDSPRPCPRIPGVARSTRCRYRLEGETVQPHADHDFWEKNWRSDTAKGPDHPDAPTWRNEIDARVLAFIRPYLPQRGVVAEIGCGSGRLLSRIGRERAV